MTFDGVLTENFKYSIQDQTIWSFTTQFDENYTFINITGVFQSYLIKTTRLKLNEK